MPRDPAAVEAIFDQAAQQSSPDARAAVLDRACDGQPELRQLIERLLESHDAAGSFMAAPDQTIDDPSSVAAHGTGMQLGRYKLLQQIGEGGMGTVYMAEQSHPVRRSVAVKIIKPGMDSRLVIARFEAERQALALMDHPNIARVLDAGETDSGQPYFVMELVKGIPITAYCDQHHLTPRQRLELFIPVCQAVQHAHQKGIIHRDLKPSNVLVATYDGKPVPKVIDFGVAKATGPRLTDKTLFTEFGQVVGTLEYMSPEQAELNQLDIDTRSDIYALGVLLYELLTGSTPLDRKRLKEGALLEMLRVVREEEPPRPSTRLTTAVELPSIAANRGVEPRRLSREIAGELDWITMRCLEKDRALRYETANALAMDVRRYLVDEPVTACPPSALYRFRKFARRKKRALVLAGVIATALLLAMGSFGWMLRDRAAGRHAIEKEVTRVLNQAQDAYQQDRIPQALAVLQQAEALLARDGASDNLRAEARRWRLDLEMAEKLEQIRIAKTTVKRDDFDVAGARTAYLEAFRGHGLDVDALGVEQSARRIRSSPIRNHLLAALDDWMIHSGPRLQTLVAIANQADSDPWRARLRRVLSGSDVISLKELAHQADAVEQPAANMLLLNHLLVRGDEIALAVELLRKAQNRRPQDFWVNHYLGVALLQLKPAQHVEATAYFRVAVALRPDSAGAYVNLGYALSARADQNQAIEAYRRATELKADYAAPHANIAVCLNRQEKWEQAVAAAQKAIALKADFAAAYSSLGLAYGGLRRWDDAFTAHRKAIDLNPEFAEAHVHLAFTHIGLQQWNEAISALGRAIELKPDLAEAHLNLADAYYGQGKWPQAIDAGRRAIELKPEIAKAHNNLGLALQRDGKIDDAMAAYRRALVLQPDSAEAQANLANALRLQGRRAEAVVEFRKAVAVRPGWAQTHLGLGVALFEQGRMDDAAASFRQAIAADPRLHEAHYNLGVALQHQEKLDEAIAAYRKAIECNPEHTEALLNLGHLLRDKGALTDALAMLKRGHALGSRDPRWPHPSAQWVRECEELIEQERLLKGK